MREEEQRRPFGHAGVVKGSDDRLARTRSSDDEIAVKIVDLSLSLQLLEHLELVWIRLDRQAAHRVGDGAAFLEAAGDTQRLV